ncbi:methyl-accepting chemotaxis protein [Stenotrophomonas maltophilia]|uniref:methyl-accepting chemotaxis protein n=1 Tax=Stenotrophomonas maltophilia TaxID=40324 RepID=UPI0024188901|nr:methyl-accepting chemotaxis protein [Stenotrophomonas maltophilia]
MKGVNVKNFLMRFRVGTRLSAAFAILIAVAMSIVASGLWTLSRAERSMDSIVKESMERIRLSKSMASANMQISISLRELIMLQDKDVQASLMRKIAEQRKVYDEARDALYATPADEEGKRIRAVITEKRLAARRVNDSVVEAASQGDVVQATKLLAEGDVLLNEWQAAIFANAELQERLADASYREAQAASASGRTMLITAGLLAIVLSIALAIAITRSLTVPLEQATRTANAIALGGIENLIKVEGRDETAALLRSMSAMQDRIKALIADQEEMASAQAEGRTSHRIDSSRHPGAFGQLAIDTNAMVERSNMLIEQIVDIAQHYAIGDMSVRMEALPGDQTAITEAMETTRSNLLAINEEIRRLVQAAALGDFSQRGTSDGFSHSFREMIDNLNQMFDVSDRSLSSIASLLGAVAQGDLTYRVAGQFSGVFAKMRDAANSSSEQLGSIVRGIQDGAGVIRVSAAEVSKGSSDLSRRTEQQAANLEETAASMEELTSTVRQNADHAMQASKLASDAGELALQGGRAVDRAMERMEKVEGSSQRIADITAVIDGIAFQTNILALNAAVEAARAGDQGRGFAVVASEVRTLAQRSAEAAKEIKQLIDRSVQDVVDSSNEVRQTGATIHQVVESVQRVRDMITEISAASQEQTAGIEQVNQAVMQMDEVTQQNAALVEEASAAAGAVEDQADGLAQAVAFFKVNTEFRPRLVHAS